MTPLVVWSLYIIMKGKFVSKTAGWWEAAQIKGLDLKDSEKIAVFLRFTSKQDIT